MKHLTHSSLSSIGINPLTGEACAFAMRILCDLNADGMELITDWIGLPKFPAPAFAEPFNPGTPINGYPALGSVMLSRETLPALARFALFRDGYQYIVGRDDMLAYMAFSDSDLADHPALQLYLDGSSWLMHESGQHLYRNPRGAGGQPHVGSRNVHAMSGRTL